MKANKILLVATVAIVGLLASCGNNSSSSNNVSSDVVAAKTVEFGLGYVASYSESSSQLTVTVAAVGVDSDGKVIDARVDAVQVNLGATKGEGGTYTFAPTGSSYSDGVIKSKLELGTNYGMVAWGGASAEVDVQMEAIADYCVGKTATEIAATESISGVSITTSAYTTAIGSAIANKRAAVEYTGDIYAGVGITASYAASGTEGASEATVAINGVVVDADSKVVASYSDAIVADFSAPVETVDGETTTTTISLTANKYVVDGVITSKHDLKEAYGMNAAMGVNEWYVQAEAFDAAIVGKTADEIQAAESFAGVTIKTPAFVSSAVEAVTYATLEHVGPQA